MRKKEGRNTLFLPFLFGFRAVRLDRDGLDLDQRALGQGGRLHRTACGALAGKILAVHLVDNAEIADIDHKHGRLDNVLSLAASRLEHREQILDALLRLLGRAAGNKCAGPAEAGRRQIQNRLLRSPGSRGRRRRGQWS